MRQPSHRDAVHTRGRHAGDRLEVDVSGRLQLDGAPTLVSEFAQRGHEALHHRWAHVVEQYDVSATTNGRARFVRVARLGGHAHVVADLGAQVAQNLFDRPTGKVDVVAGGYEDWERKRRQPIAGKPKAEKQVEKPAAAPPPAKSNKLSYKDQRDFELLPTRIEELETAIAKGEAILSDPELYTADPQRFANISKGLENARAEKDAAEERWLMLAEAVEG